VASALLSRAAYIGAIGSLLARKFSLFLFLAACSQTAEISHFPRSRREIYPSNFGFFAVYTLFTGKSAQRPTRSRLRRAPLFS